MESDEQLPCADKLAFDTKDQAAATATASDWQYGANLTPYKCSHCGLWHLSSQPSD